MLFDHWDFVHLPEADYQIDTIRYVTFAHDWRRVGVAEWLERTAARELGEPVSQPVEPAAALSHEEFAVAVKEALRSLHQPQALLRNPLLASSMVQTALREHPDSRPDERLRELIFEAAQRAQVGSASRQPVPSAEPHLPPTCTHTGEGRRAA